MRPQHIFQSVLLLAIALGIYFRLDHINSNQLFYYDEGHYLTIHRTFDEMLNANPPKSFGEFLTIMKYNLLLSLKTGKGLWFFISHLRGFWGGFGAFYFPKLMASLFGIATLGAVYIFAKNYYANKVTALLATAALAILPSHVFYSRLGLQETLSAFCLLAGFYFFLFPKKFGWRSILAAVFFALAYFSNYRMFIIPGLVGFVELFQWFLLKEKIDWRKLSWCFVVFAGIIITLGLLDNAGHMRIIFFWMLRQGAQAQGHFHWMNFFSYPYAVFKLEGIIFGLIFFGSVILMFKQKGQYQMPLALALFLMLIFSLAHEKGTRYLVVVMPFMAMAVAHTAHTLLQWQTSKLKHALCLGLLILMGASQVVSANQIRGFKSDYLVSVQELKVKDVRPKILTSQPFIQNLYLPKRDDAIEMPINFNGVASGLLNDYQYMIICPQAYVSHTKSTMRFDTKLEDHLEFALENITPIKTYEHFSPAMLERFVLEHNVNLNQSLEFLKASKTKEFHQLKVYRTSDYVNEVLRRLQMRNMLKETGSGV